MREERRIVQPFPGLRPFETDEYRLFFGREGQSDELLTRLGRTRFLAVVGTSGSGKSSLVRAGLLPSLRGGLMRGASSAWRVAVMRPGGDPVGNLAVELARKGVLAEAGGGLEGLEAVAVIEATLRGGSRGLVEAARQAHLAAHENLLVVVDQFEELFRFRALRAGEGTADEASAFVKLLLEASAQRELPVYVVLTMRSDFLGDCAQFQGLPEAINDGQYLIPRMTRDERRSAIVGPARVARGRVSEQLVNRLLNDVGDNPDQLPILQHALMRTWDYWQTHRQNGEPVEVRHYEAVGAMRDALSRHADEAWNELSDEQQRIAERMFKALTEKGADNREIRRPTRLREICEITGASKDEVIEVVNVFRREGRSFLMPPHEVVLDSESVIDISHESLIRNWERLKKWVDEEAQAARTYRRLAETAVLHREGKEGTLTPVALQNALEWQHRTAPNEAWGVRYHEEYDLAMQFLAASKREREAEAAREEQQRQAELERERREREQAERYAQEQRRAARRLRALLVGMGVMFLVALAIAAFALDARRSAVNAQAEAYRAREVAIGALADAVRLKETAEQAKRTAEEEKARADASRASEEQAKKDALASAGRAEEERKKADAERVRAQAAATSAKEALDKLNAEVANDHRNRDALASFLRGNMEDAETNFVKLLPIYAGEPQRQAWVYSYLGAARRKLGKLDESVTDLKTAQGIQERFIRQGTMQQGDPEYLDTITWLAHAHADKGQYERAQPLYEGALRIRRAGGRHTDVAVSLENLARNHVNLGQPAEAAKLYDEALGLRRGNSHSPDLIAALKEAAEFHFAYDDDGAPAAARLYEEALKNQEAYLAPDDPNIADTFDAYAQLYEDTPLQKLGDSYSKLAKEMRKVRLYKGDSAEKVPVMRALALRYVEVGRLRRAAQVFVGAHEMAVRLEKAETRSTVDDYIRLGGYIGALAVAATDPTERQSFYERSVAAYKQALDIIERNAFDNYRADALDGLAATHLQQKNFAEAERVYKQVLALREREPDVLSSEHRLVENLDGLAQAAAGLGKPNEAEMYLLRANKVFDGTSKATLSMVHHTRGIDPHILRVKTGARLAELYRAQNRAKEADEQYRAVAASMKMLQPEYLMVEDIAREYLDTIEAAGRFYTARGDTAAAESFYRLVWPEGVAPTVNTVPVWPEELYKTTPMALAPASTADSMIRILNSFAELLRKTGRAREADGIAHGVVRLQLRMIKEGLTPPSP